MSTTAPKSHGRIRVGILVRALDGRFVAPVDRIVDGVLDQAGPDFIVTPKAA